MFEVGQKVVCVDANTLAIAGGRVSGQLKNGHIYQINGQWDDADWGYCVTVSGIFARTVNGGFLACRFRPLRPNEASARESWAEMLTNPAKVRV